MTDEYDLEQQQTEQFYKNMEYNQKLRARAEERQLDRQLDDQEAVGKVMQAQAKALESSLKEAGLSQEDYFKMLRENPAQAEKAVVEGTKEMVGKFIRQRDARGRYIPSATPQEQPQGLPNLSEQSPAIRGGSERTAELKERVVKGHQATDEELEGAVDDIFGKLI